MKKFLREVRSHKMSLRVIFTLFVTACSDNIDTVRQGTLKGQRDILIGAGFDASPLCTDERQWKEIEEPNGAISVEFRCRAALEKFVEKGADIKRECPRILNTLRKGNGLATAFISVPQRCSENLERSITGLADSGAFIAVQFAIAAQDKSLFYLKYAAFERYDRQSCYTSSLIASNIPLALVSGSMSRYLNETGLGLNALDILKMCLYSALEQATRTELEQTTSTEIEQVGNSTALRSTPQRALPEETSAVRTEGVTFPFPEYLQNINRQILLQFRPLRSGALTAEVLFFIHRDGSVSGFRFTERSGNLAFDVEAERAVEAVKGRFGPLPKDFGDDILPITYKYISQEQ